MEKTSEVFCSSDLNGSITNRFFNIPIISPKSKRAKSFVKNAYIDKSINQQKQFLTINIRKSSDFKNYDISPMSPPKTSRSRYCIKPELKPQFKNQIKIRSHFSFRMIKSSVTASKASSRKNKLSQNKKTKLRLINGGLLSFLKESALPNLRDNSIDKLELTLTRRRLA